LAPYLLSLGSRFLELDLEFVELLVFGFEDFSDFRFGGVFLG